MNDQLEMVAVTTKPCMGCRRTSQISMTRKQLEAYKAGGFVQDVFREWTAEQRELVVSGTHPACWTEMFGEEE